MDKRAEQELNALLELKRNLEQRDRLLERVKSERERLVKIHGRLQATANAKADEEMEEHNFTEEAEKMAEKAQAKAKVFSNILFVIVFYLVFGAVFVYVCHGLISGSIDSLTIGDLVGNSKENVAFKGNYLFPIVYGILSLALGSLIYWIDWEFLI